MAGALDVRTSRMRKAAVLLGDFVDRLDAAADPDDAELITNVAGESSELGQLPSRWAAHIAARGTRSVLAVVGAESSRRAAA
jgi:hypothetical protein